MTVKLGRFETIDNTNKPVFSHAKDKYVAGYVCSPEGGEAQYLMFADTELTNSCFVESDLDLDMGVLYRISQSGKVSYMLKCVMGDNTVIIKLPACKIKRALYRTVRNPEDVKELSFWDRIFK